MTKFTEHNSDRLARFDQEEVRLLLDYKAAAKALCMSRAALRDLVYKNRAPVVTKIASRTFFAIKDLEDFVEAHRVVADK